MTAFERVLFIAGMSITALASVGLCMQVYLWRNNCAHDESVARPSIFRTATGGC